MKHIEDDLRPSGEPPPKAAEPDALPAALQVAGAIAVLVVAMFMINVRDNLIATAGFALFVVAVGFAVVAARNLVTKEK